MLTVKCMDFLQWLCYTFLYSNNDSGAEKVLKDNEVLS